MTRITRSCDAARLALPHSAGTRPFRCRSPLRFAREAVCISPGVEGVLSFCSNHPLARRVVSSSPVASSMRLREGRARIRAHWSEARSSGKAYPGDGAGRSIGRDTTGKLVSARNRSGQYGSNFDSTSSAQVCVPFSGRDSRALPRQDQTTRGCLWKVLGQTSADR